MQNFSFLSGLGTQWQALGVYANVKVCEYSLSFVPLDSDVLSLELPLCLRDCLLSGDRTDLHHTAAGVMQLQVTGFVRTIDPAVDLRTNHAYCRQRRACTGECVVLPLVLSRTHTHILYVRLTRQQVADIVQRMQREVPASTATPEIETLVIVDRTVDLVTPMCTQVCVAVRGTCGGTVVFSIVVQSIMTSPTHWPVDVRGAHRRTLEHLVW